MKTKKALLFSAVAIMIALAIFLIRSHRPLPDESARLEAEREIYALLISDFQGEEDIVNFPIAEYTTLGEYGGTGNLFTRLADSGVVKQETVRDFEESNLESYPIREYLPIPIAEGLIRPQGWRLSFSRIGFDPYFTEALVVREHYLGCDADGNCHYGTGAVMLLKNILGTWVIQGDFGQWLMEDA
jgi:hypothetical protein